MCRKLFLRCFNSGPFHNSGHVCFARSGPLLQTSSFLYSHILSLDTQQLFTLCFCFSLFFMGCILPNTDDLWQVKPSALIVSCPLRLDATGYVLAVAVVGVENCTNCRCYNKS